MPEPGYHRSAGHTPETIYWESVLMTRNFGHNLN